MKKHAAQPIKKLTDLKKISDYLQTHNKRDYVIWILGLNSGLRVSDIVGLNVADVVGKTHITIIEKKTKKLKSFLINNKLKSVLNDFTKGRNLDEPLFLGKQGKRLNRSQVYRFIVNTCKIVGVKAHVSTHTMRRSFGYHHYKKFKDLAMLQKIFNHSSQRITTMYIGIEQDEIDLSYKNFEL